MTQTDFPAMLGQFAAGTTTMKMHRETPIGLGISTRETAKTVGSDDQARRAGDRRTVTFTKRERWWLIEDEFFGGGRHDFAVRFHFDRELEVNIYNDTLAVGSGKIRGTRLFICALDLKQQPEFESQFTSRDYGEKGPSTSARWSISSTVPCRFRWAIVPACGSDDERERLSLIAHLREPHSRPSPRGSG